MSEVKLGVINRAESLVCIHIPSSVTPTTSKHSGFAYICSDSENSPTKAYTEANGNEIKDSESVNVKGGFFRKIISFFKNLFRMNRTVVQSIFKGAF